MFIDYLLSYSVSRYASGPKSRLLGCAETRGEHPRLQGSKGFFQPSMPLVARAKARMFTGSSMGPAGLPCRVTPARESLAAVAACCEHGKLRHRPGSKGFGFPSRIHVVPGLRVRRPAFLERPVVSLRLPLVSKVGLP